MAECYHDIESTWWGPEIAKLVQIATGNLKKNFDEAKVSPLLKLLLYEQLIPHIVLLSLQNLIWLWWPARLLVWNDVGVSPISMKVPCGATVVLALEVLPLKMVLNCTGDLYHMFYVFIFSQTSFLC